jgi:hypothetical protein
MIDNFAIGLTHGLMMLAAIILLFRRDLDKEAPPESTSDSLEPEVERRHRARQSNPNSNATNRVRRTWGSPPDA